GSCAIVAGAAGYDLWRAPVPSVLPLQARDVEGRLRVQWDSSPEYVRKANGATLEVLDGGRVQRYPVDPRVVQRGTLDYIRQTDDVVLTLTLHGERGSGPQGVIRTVSSPLTAAVQSSDAGERKRIVTDPRARQTRSRRSSGRRR
ncbi:MAG TPA: hypothetical protein VFL57_16150, partial [Bryobacteraceae bacterium]|nr:hypothetical protein [Bryobacteraceae bacterium]